MKYKNMPELEIIVGDKVRATNEKLHEVSPDYFPEPGIVGVVTVADDGSGVTKIRWPEGTTKFPDAFTPSEWIAFVSRKG